MRVRLLLLLAAAPLMAELKQVSIRFTPSECVSCTQSLPERFRRIRGVSHAALVAGDQPAVEVKFEVGNRVRIGRLRETIEQDGAKWIEARIAAAGRCEKDGERWVLKLFDADQGVALRGKVEEGTCTVQGRIGVDGVLEVE